MKNTKRSRIKREEQSALKEWQFGSLSNDSDIESIQEIEPSQWYCQWCQNVGRLFYNINIEVLVTIHLLSFDSDRRIRDDLLAVGAK